MTGGGVSLKIRKNLGRRRGVEEKETGERKQEEVENWHIVSELGRVDNGMVIALNEGTRCWWRDKHHTLPEASRAKQNPKEW